MASSTITNILECRIRTIDSTSDFNDPVSMIGGDSDGVYFFYFGSSTPSNAPTSNIQYASVAIFKRGNLVHEIVCNIRHLYLRNVTLGSTPSYGSWYNYDGTEMT